MIQVWWFPDADPNPRMRHCWLVRHPDCGLAWVFCRPGGWEAREVYVRPMPTREPEWPEVLQMLSDVAGIPLPERLCTKEEAMRGVMRLQGEIIAQIGEFDRRPVRA